MRSSLEIGHEITDGMASFDAAQRRSTPRIPCTTLPSTNMQYLKAAIVSSGLAILNPSHRPKAVNALSRCPAK